MDLVDLTLTLLLLAAVAGVLLATAVTVRHDRGAPPRSHALDAFDPRAGGRA